MLPCFSVLRLGRCRGRVRFAVLPLAPLNGTMSKLFPSVVETATGLAGSTLSNSSTGLSRISANEFPCRTSILIISGDSLYIHCITVQAGIFYPNTRSPAGPEDALKIIHQLITAPAGQFISIARLKIDPVWDPIRDNPDFQKLIAGPEPETVYK
jgi:hypothetical protein